MSQEIFKTEIQDFYGRRTTFAELGLKIKRKLANEAKDDIYDVLVTGANNIRNRMIRSMVNSPKTGKLYHRGKNSKGKEVYHRASSPGNPPRPDNSDLIRSIQMDARYDEVEVGSTITQPNYPWFLEKGTPKMKARPWCEPAFKAYEPDIKRNLMGALRAAAGRLGAK
jgi:hypothetical protein